MSEKNYHPGIQRQNKTTEAVSEPQAYYAAAASSPAEETLSIPHLPYPPSAVLVLKGAGSSRDALLKDARYSGRRCACWRDAEELSSKTALLELLRQGETPAAVAEYLNCSVHQVYRAMRHHHIPTSRAFRKNGRLVLQDRM